jgi:2-polyprenyl-3-methyl-5-hydroxy-6-metoxy-1,4-benzoquinol methylase
MSKKTRCPLCKYSVLRKDFITKDFRYGVKGSFLYLECSNCGLGIRKNQDIFYGYSSGYYAYKKNKISRSSKFFYPLFYSENRTFFQKLFSFLLFPFRMFTRGIIIKRNWNYLDVGCGAGDFLYKMKYFGMKCHGIEISQEAASKIKKDFPIKNTETSNADFKSSYFDVITMNHVIEHSLNPIKDLKNLNRMLKKKSILIVGIPNKDSLAFSIFKKYWVQIDAPRHNYLFSKNTLSKALKKTGFNIIKIRYCSQPFQFTSSLYNLLNDKYSLDIPFLKSRFCFYLFLPLAVFVNIINKGDSVEIWAEKI